MSRFTEDVDALGQFFLHQVNEDGCIWTTYPHSGTCAAGHSEFPVGQAMVALERMHRRTGEARWLDALERAARFYRGYYEGVDFRDEIYFVPWATGPMVGLLLERPDPDLEAFVFEMADHQVGDQYLDEGDPLRLGGFKRRSGRVPTWSAASMVEGIVDAYRLAEARGDRERTRRYRQAGILGAKFLMSLQYRASNVGGFDLADPERAIGAYHFSNEEPESDFSMHWLRTDFMDHFAITMLKTLTYLDLPETYPGEGFAR